MTTFHLDDYDRSFTSDQIVDLLTEVLEIVEKVDPPDSLELACFNVANAMVSTVSPKETGIVKAPAMAIPRER